MNQLRFEAGYASGEVQHSSAQSRHEDVAADHVADKDMLTHSVEAQPQRSARTFRQELWALAKTLCARIEVNEVLRDHVVAPFRDRVEVDLFDVEQRSSSQVNFRHQLQPWSSRRFASATMDRRSPVNGSVRPWSTSS